MPTFLETVIAKGFDELWRLDALIDAHPLLAGAINGENAECFPIAVGHVHEHGVASPIETDPASRAMSGRVGTYTPTGAIDRRNNFCHFAFGYSADTAGNKTLLCRSGHWGTSIALASGPPVLANISKVSFLRLCTAPDQFELRYHRDGSDFLAECEFVFSELLTTPG